MLLRRLWMSFVLEVQSQTELHTAEGVSAEGVSVESESRIRQCVAEVYRSVVEANRVCEVVNLPGKLQSRSLTQAPCLGQRCVKVEDAISAEDISRTGFSRIWKANWRTGSHASADRIHIGEDLRQSVAFIVLLYLDLLSRNSPGLKLPVCCPIRAR